MLRVALSAAMLVAVFPGFGFHPISWIALIPLFSLIARSGAAKAFLFSLVTGVLFHAGMMWWVLDVKGTTIVNFGVMNFYCALFVGVFGATASYLHRKLPDLDALTFPSVWVTLEYLRAHSGFLSYPQGIMGYSQYLFLPAARFSSLAGVYGVSFLIVAVNAALFRIIQDRLDETERGSMPAIVRTRSLKVSFGVLGFAALVLLTSATSVTVAGEAEGAGGRLKVALVQPNGNTWEKDFEKKYLSEYFPSYERLTLLAAEAGPSLIVWPSTSVAGTLPVDANMVGVLSGLSRKTGSWLLVGAYGFDKFSPVQRKTGRVANSSFLFSPVGAITGRYDKIRLFPFGEYMPLRDFIKWPSRIFPKEFKEKHAGANIKIFTTGQARFGVQICWENMFPDAIRRIAADGADFVVGQSDEGFTKSQGAHYQMLSYYVFRAIENGIPVVKSSNDGVSCVIDTGGRIVTSVRDKEGKEIGISGISIASVPLGAKRSLYNRCGDAFVFMTILGSVVSFLVALHSGISRG